MRDMNKQELLNELNKVMDQRMIESSFSNGIKTGVTLGIRLVEKLDEPSKVEPLVVPKILAEWYEESKDELEFDIFNLVDTIGEKDYDELTEIEAWFNNIGNEPIETIMKMKLFGYEIEKEKLYYVLDKQGKTLLVLMGGEVRISGGYVLSESTATKDIYQLTEKQIKDYDERFWEFAVEVAE